MGKASRTKRERREAPPAPIQPPTRTIPVFWLTLAVIIVGGLATLVLTRPNEQDRAIDTAAKRVPAYAQVTTTGASLPTWDGTGTDRAVGRTVPELRGTTFEGFHRTYAPGDATARVYVVVAHWCPHCRKEVPLLAEWADAHPTVRGVEFVTLSTAVSQDQPNFPPAAWLQREHWPWDVLIDDEVGTGAAALGVEGFPYLVFVDKDGIVQRRFSGEMPIDEFDAAVAALG